MTLAHSNVVLCHKAVKLMDTHAGWQPVKKVFEEVAHDILGYNELLFTILLVVVSATSTTQSAWSGPKGLDVTCIPESEHVVLQPREQSVALLSHAWLSSIW